MSGEIEVVNPTAGALSVADMRQQVNLIQNIMKEIMHEGEHYGVIPGTSRPCSCKGKDPKCPDCGGTGDRSKPTLLKPGAEKLCFAFRLDPQFEVTQVMEEDHLTILSKCVLYHIGSGARLGSGFGSCSTKESKYAYRKASRKCPSCGKETIIKGKAEYSKGIEGYENGGFLCFAKKGGCGIKFPDDAPEITTQVEGRMPNEDIADQYNTVLKMANKRSLVAAVLVTTAASDIFTQDIEEMKPDDLGHKAETKAPESVKAPPAAEHVPPTTKTEAPMKSAHPAVDPAKEEAAFLDFKAVIAESGAFNLNKGVRDAVSKSYILSDAHKKVLIGLIEARIKSPAAAK